MIDEHLNAIHKKIDITWKINYTLYINFSNSSIAISLLWLSMWFDWLFVGVYIVKIVANNFVIQLFENAGIENINSLNLYWITQSLGFHHFNIRAYTDKPWWISTYMKKSTWKTNVSFWRGFWYVCYPAVSHTSLAL